MPRPFTVVPWTAIACCELCAAAIAEVATSIFFCVARWLNQASVTRRIDATTASIPIQKWSRKAVKQEDGGPRRVEHRGHGRRRDRRADQVEIAHGLARRARILGHHLLEDPGASKASIRWLARTSSRLRTMSRIESVSSASASAIVTNSKVVLPPVGTTRS